jgi:hypothetical protein
MILIVEKTLHKVANMLCKKRYQSKAEVYSRRISGKRLKKR